MRANGVARIAILALFALMLASCSRPVSDGVQDADRRAAEAAAEAEAAAAMSMSAVALSRVPANPYPSAKTVRLFVMGSDGGPIAVDARWPQGRPVSADERQAIEATMEIVQWSHPQPEVGCCVPHHFLRYYDAGGRQVGEIAICFCCGCIRAAPVIASSAGSLEFEVDKLKAVIASMGVPTNINCVS